MVERRTVVSQKEMDPNQLYYEENEILKPLRKMVKMKTGRDNRIKLPSYITFRIEAKCLFMYIQKQVDNLGQISYQTSENMQSDKVAFEGWAIVLKTWFNDRIDKVLLKWDIPVEMTTADKRHYNRFLYRCVRFREFYSWFSVDKSNEKELSDFNERYTNLTINCSSKVSDKKSNTENAIEYEFVEMKNQANRIVFLQRFNLKVLDHALPVGVKSCSKSFFTGGQSAIDIWGIDNDDYLNIFELKIDINIKVGIISELFFYACVVRDLRMKTIKACDATIDTQKTLYNCITSLKGIKAFMLVVNLHPLVDNPAVFETLNAPFDLTNIKFDMVKYQYERGMYNLKFIK